MEYEKQHSFWKRAQELHESCSPSPPRGPGGSASRQLAAGWEGGEGERWGRGEAGSRRTEEEERRRDGGRRGARRGKGMRGGGEEGEMRVPGRGKLSPGSQVKPSAQALRSNCGKCWREK